MTDRGQRMQIYADIVQRMSGALRSASLYSTAHPSVGEHVRALLEAVQRLHRMEASVLVGFIGGEVIADDTPLLAVTAYRTELIRYMQALGINRVLFDRGVTLEELTQFVRAVSQPSAAALHAAEGDAGPAGGGRLHQARARARRPHPRRHLRGEVGFERRHAEAGLQRVGRGRPHGLGEHAG